MGVASTHDAQRIHVAICSEPIDLAATVEHVRDPRAGAEVLFLGTTRDVEQLDYEAYGEMALALMDEIARAVVREHGLCAAAIVHRVGTVPLSEASVAVAASAPHRPEAFAGARALIDAVKERVPIWKREIEGADKRWVPGQTPPAPAASGP